MIKIYSLINGDIVRLVETPEQETLGGSLSNYSYLVEYDDDTNPLLASDIKENWNDYKLISGNLTKRGVAVTINPLSEQHQAEALSKTGYANLALWARTGTAAEAETYINGQVWNGQTITQVNVWIDANITGTTIAQLRAQMITALKLEAAAIIAMRGLFILTAKLLIYIRDLVIRFKI